MAGSYNHAVDKRTGKLLRWEQMPKMVENAGDAYETIEEMYGMIWYLADGWEADMQEDYGIVSAEVVKARVATRVEEARRNYAVGIAASPGTDGELADDGDD